jgi:hypothetical protein
MALHMGTLQPRGAFERFRVTIRHDLRRWRARGPRRGSWIVLRLLARRAKGGYRSARNHLRPLRVEDSELFAALGATDPRRVLRGQTLGALPTVAALEAELGRDSELRDRLVVCADRILAHELDLFASGPVAVGPEIDWHQDFTTGVRWAARHSAAFRLVYPDESDVLVPLALSWCQHFPVLAAGYRVTGDDKYLEELGEEISHWISSNPPEFGLGWANPLSAALRSVSWTAALVLCAEYGGSQPWFRAALASLLLHGRFLRARISDEPRNNHYVVCAAALVILSAIFPASAEAREWMEFGARELPAEMVRQVRADGCADEGSTAYHRLVCEAFLCGSQALDALAPGRVPTWYRERLDRMLDFVADYTRPDGCAPQIGDWGLWRFLPLADYCAGRPGSHLHLFSQAGRSYRPARGHAAYPLGGYYVMRAQGLYVIVRCGTAGIVGHEHDDQLSFELALGPQPMIIDPGTYAYYTRSTELHELFRSSRFHATLSVGSAAASGNARRGAAISAWEAQGDRALFEGRWELDGTAAELTRRLEFDAARLCVTVRDTVSSAGGEPVEWTFPLAPSSATASVEGVNAEFERGALMISSAAVELRIEDGWFSPSYGKRIAVPFVRARRHASAGENVTEFTIRVQG